MKTPRQPNPALSRRHPLFRPALLIPLGVLIAIVVALLAAPEFIDWNRYRDRIASAIEQKLGRAVSIEGSLSLTLLPVPQIVAEQIHVANIAGAADQNFISADRLELRLRGLPLLAGRFEVSSLILSHPRIHIERLADGRANWRFVPAPDVHVHAPAPAGTEQRESFQLLADGDRSGLQRIELRNALVTVRLPRVGTITADGVDADATANGATGPFQFHLTGHDGDVPMSLQGSVGRFDAKETPVDVTLDAGDGAARISVGGTLTGNDAATVMNGRLTVKTAHADRVAALIGGAAPDGPAELRGTIAASLHEIAVQNMTLDIPGASLTGFTAVNLEGDPQFDLKLAAARLDPTLWLKVKAPNTEATEKKGSGATTAPAAFLSAMSGVAFKLPAWLGASIDLSVESIPWNGVLIRGARLDALLANGEVTINQVGATLPGGSQINLFGFVDSTKGKPNFDGSFETGTDDLRALLHWLAIDVSGVPEDRLGAARFTGHLAASPERIKLDGAEIRVDGTRVTTAVDLRLPSATTPRPALGASFSIDTLNADAYRAHAATKAASPGSTPATPPASGSKATQVGLGQWLGSFDANIKGHVGQLVAGGVTFSTLDLDGALVNGALTLRSLTVADVDGAKANLSGVVAGLDGTPHLDGLKLDATAADPHVALGTLGIIAPSGDLGPLTVSAEFDGDMAGVLVQSRSTVAGLEAKIDGRVTSPLAEPGLDLHATLTHASLAGALHLLGLDYPHRAGSQPASAAFHVLGDPRRLSFDDVRLAVGDIAASGHAMVTFGDRTHIDGALTAGDVPIDALLGVPDPAAAVRPAPAPQPQAQKPNSTDPTAPQAAPRPAVAVGAIADHFSHAPIDLVWMRAVDGTLTVDATAFTWGNLKFGSPSAALTLADGKATLDKFSAKLWDGDLNISAALDDSGAISCGAQLTKAQLKQAVLGVADLALADGVVDLSIDLTTTGNSPAELMGRLAGSGKIAASDGTLKGFDLKAADDRLKTPSAASLVTLVQAGANGETKFKTLTGTVKATGGIFSTDDLTLSADGGTLSAKGAVNLPAYAMDAHADLRLADAADAPPLVLRLSGPLSNPRRVLDINPLQTWLAQRKAKPAQ